MRTLLIFFLLISSTALFSQETLNNYINEGLSNNAVLQQKKIGIERALLSLKIANGMFMPSIGIQANYTSGEGGRNISLPVGDMLNPVYATLNQLTESNQFPQIENVNQNFLPYNFYDLKIRATVPLINSDLLYNRKIQQQQVGLQQFEVDIYKRELIKNIKVAYYNYLSAVEAIKIYESALTRAEEGKRVNESLLKNGKGLPAYLLRSESEIESIRSQLTDAVNTAHNAQLYFNFLLNKESEAPIHIDQQVSINSTGISEMISSDSASNVREELRQLRTAQSMNGNVLRMKQLFWAPRLSGFVDVGSQYENWKFNSQSRYYLVGLQLDIPLFAGFTNRYKISQARLDLSQTDLSTTSVSQQINMSQQMAKNALQSSYQSYRSAEKKLEAAQSYMRLIDKGYKEGVNTFIEAIDARNQLTSAQLQTTIYQYKVLMAIANVEREMSTLTIN